AGEVRVGGDLPAGEVDRLQPRPHHLDGLAAGQRAERVDVPALGEELPEPLGAEAGERALRHDRAAEANDVLGRVRPGDAVPARVLLPAGAELVGLLLDPSLGRHRASWLSDGDSRILDCGLYPVNSGNVPSFPSSWIRNYRF